MKKTLDKIRIHPEGWKIFLDKLGISSREKAADHRNHSWDCHLNTIELGITRGYPLYEKGAT